MNDDLKCEIRIKENLVKQKSLYFVNDNLRWTKVDQLSRI